MTQYYNFAGVAGSSAGCPWMYAGRAQAAHCGYYVIAKNGESELLTAAEFPISPDSAIRPNDLSNDGLKSNHRLRAETI